MQIMFAFFNELLICMVGLPFLDPVSFERGENEKMGVPEGIEVDDGSEWKPPNLHTNSCLWLWYQHMPHPQTE